MSGCVAREDLEDTIPANRVAAMVAEEAQRQGVPVRLAVAVAETESRFNPAARSSAGAMGVMQVMPGTWRGTGCTGSPWNAQDNIRCGVGILARSLKEGSARWAVAAYHGGPGGAHGRSSQKYAQLVLQRAGLEQPGIKLAER